MLQSAFDIFRLRSGIVLDLGFSLLVIGVVYLLHKFIQRRREHEVYHPHTTHAEIKI